MKKFKFLIVSSLSLLLLSGGYVAQADAATTSNFEVVSELVLRETGTDTIYKFDSARTRDEFLKSSSGYSVRSSGVSSTRRKLARSYTSYSRTVPMGRVAYGGQAGAALTLGRGASFSDEKTGVGYTLEESVTHNVPPYKYGQIALRGSCTVNVYNLEVQYLGTKTWRPAGQVTTYSNIRTWTVLNTWGR